MNNLHERRLENVGANPPADVSSTLTYLIGEDQLQILVKALKDISSGTLPFHENQEDYLVSIVQYQQYEARSAWLLLQNLYAHYLRDEQLIPSDQFRHIDPEDIIERENQKSYSFDQRMLNVMIDVFKNVVESRVRFVEKREEYLVALICKNRTICNSLIDLMKIDFDPPFMREEYKE